LGFSKPYAAAALHEDVARLDVQVEHTCVVRVCNALQQRARDA